jgi:hypothetical protein
MRLRNSAPPWCSVGDPDLEFSPLNPAPDPTDDLKFGKNPFKQSLRKKNFITLNKCIMSMHLYDFIIKNILRRKDKKIRWYNLISWIRIRNSPR